MRYKHYKKEEIEYVRQIADGMPTREITKRFNAEFNEERTVRSVASMMSKNGIKNNLQGLACEKTQFKKGIVPWNKGKKGILKANKGSFKKGDASYYRKPVGTEVFQEGDLMIKVSQPDVWRLKSHCIWEQTNEKVPDDCVILFKDNNKAHVWADNLFMVSRSAMVSVARRELRSEHEDMNQATHYLAELDLKVKKMESAK